MHCQPRGGGSSGATAASSVRRKCAAPNGQLARFEHGGRRPRARCRRAIMAAGTGLAVATVAHRRVVALEYRAEAPTDPRPYPSKKVAPLSST